MSDGDAWSGFTTAVRCGRCGTTVPFDVRAVELRAGEPIIPCPRCAAAVDVPAFDADGFDELVLGRTAAAPSNDRPTVTEETAPEAPEADVDVADVPAELKPPVRPGRAERRRPEPDADGLIACRACGERVRIEPENVRLRWTHALLRCTACGVEVRIRRRDAYRDIDPEFPWTFASYSTAMDDAPVTEPERPRRFWRKG